MAVFMQTRVSGHCSCLCRIRCEGPRFDHCFLESSDKSSVKRLLRSEEHGCDVGFLSRFLAFPEVNQWDLEFLRVLRAMTIDQVSQDQSREGHGS